MENLSFLLFLFQICLVRCCESFRNDHEVSGDSHVECFGVRPAGQGEGPQKQLADLFDEMAILSYRSFSERSQCGVQMNEVLQEAEELNFWALRMLDASAKLPSGILSGNLNQFGDFEECLDSKGFTKNHLIEGKYCLANIDVSIDKNHQTDSKMRKVDSAIHSNWILHSEFRDQGHRIPKFETFNMGVCVPAACGSEEIEAAMGERLSKTFGNGTFEFRVAVDDELCYVKKENKVSAMGLIVRFTFLTILSLIVLGTLSELNKISIGNAKLSRILLCFSFKKNMHLLLNTKCPHDDIKCIHGARFLNAVALLLSHKQIAMLFSPFLNRTPMSEKPFWKASSGMKNYTEMNLHFKLFSNGTCYNVIFSIGSFAVIHGLLASYSMIKELDRKKIMNFKDKLISRIFRLTPNLVCVILFCTYIMDAMGSGPQWGLVVTKYTHLCHKYMWRNFLFIHNYFGFENMCLTHTHQLGIDMQLFLVSPVFIYLIWKIPRIGTLILVAVSAGSTWLRYDRTLRENLSTLLYYGISVERLWKTANTSYILPAHRLTVYLTGILLGYYLRRGGRILNLSVSQATIGWVLAISAGLLAVFGPCQAAFKEYEYNVEEAARFNAFAPVLWTVFMSWGLLACSNGYGGILNVFLSWKYFPIFTRISYAVYLTQFPVFFYYVGTERTVQYYKGFHSLFDVAELAVIFGTSIILTLAVDIPFQELKKVLTSSTNCTQQIRNETEAAETMARGSRRKERRRLQSFGRMGRRRNVKRPEIKEGLTTDLNGTNQKKQNDGNCTTITKVL